MAETQRQTSTLLTNLADNVAGDISPEDLRDAIVSALGGYGGLKTTSTPASQGSVGTSPTKLLGWDATLPDDGTVVQGNTTDDDIDVSVAADYLVTGHLNFSASTTASLGWAFTVYVNSIATDVKVAVTSPASGAMDSVAFSGIITVGATQVVELRVNASGAGNTIALDAGCCLSLKRLS